MTAVFASAASPAGEAAHRGRLYKLLALGFSYPDPEFHASILSGEYRKALLNELRAVSQFAPVAHTWEKLLIKGEKVLKKIDAEGLEVLYTSTFDVGNPSPPCPPYEGLYREGEDRAAIMVEVSGFYRFFGLAINTADNYAELPDHLCAELEFMHFLATKEAEARTQGDEEQTKSLLRAQRDFLERHLNSWVSVYAMKMKKKEAVPLFVNLAKLVAAVVEADTRSLLERMPHPVIELDMGEGLQPAQA